MSRYVLANIQIPILVKNNGYIQLLNDYAKSSIVGYCCLPETIEDDNLHKKIMDFLMITSVETSTETSTETSVETFVETSVENSNNTNINTSIEPSNNINTSIQDPFPFIILNKDSIKSRRHSKNLTFKNQQTSKNITRKNLLP